MRKVKYKVTKKAADSEKKRLLDVLGRNMGLIHQTCKMANIPYEMHRQWMETDSVYAEHVRNIENSTIDFAEAVLLSLIKEKNLQATIFYLKTKGASRGYDKDTQDVIKDSSSEIQELSKEERRNVIKQLMMRTNGEEKTINN
jgi:hypothetical protein